MREDTLPIEFAELTSRVHYVRQRTKTEWSSSCPECGGEPHQHGDFPDRFRMWPVSKHGAPLGWCRHCGYAWTPAKERKPTREEIEAWRLEQIRIETERKKAAERALELLHSQKLWERFYNQHTDGSRAVVRSWGLSDSWQEYLQIGYNPNYQVWRGKEVQYSSPAITIPVWSAEDNVQNIKIRVLNPADDADRYRNQYSTGEHYLYVPLHESPLCGKGILFEGEKKAAVAEANIRSFHRCMGVQSKRPDPEIFRLMDNMELIYIWPDPDAFVPDKNGGRAVDYWIKQLGRERVRVVQCPVKVDDGIVKYGLDIEKYLRMAVKA